MGQPNDACKSYKSWKECKDKEYHFLNTMTKETKQEGFLKKGGKWGAIIGATWIGLNIVLPLALLRIPAVQKYLMAFEEKLPFDIPGIG